MEIETTLDAGIACGRSCVEDPSDEETFLVNNCELCVKAITRQDS